MYEYIKGKLTDIKQNYVIVEAGGIGYKIFMSKRDLPNSDAKNGEMTLLTYLYIKEDVRELYGFVSEQQRRMFLMLLSVKGVGLKAAVNILSVASPEQIALAVVNGDAKFITQAQGVGAKVAARIVLELEDKVKKSGMEISDSTESYAPVPHARVEAVNALMVLGYSHQQATAAVNSVEDGLTLEQTIKQALRTMV